MSSDGIDFKLVSKLLPGDVRSYLSSRGWNRVDDVPGEIAVFRHPENELIEAVVPLNAGYSDYASSMAALVSVVSRAEQRTRIAVINDLLLPTSADVLRFRLDDFNTRRGTVPFGDGLSLLLSAKRALLSSACSIVQPQNFHPRLSRAEADEFLSRCQLGQTERGSYIASVICPVDFPPVPEISHALFPEAVAVEPEDPFSRKVTKALIRSADEITNSIKYNRLDDLVRSLKHDPRISANFCEAFAEIEPNSEDAAIEVSIAWARSGRVPVNIPISVVIPKEYFPQIRELGRQLRPSEPAQKSAHFVGIVDSLGGSPGIDGLMQGEVVLSVVADDGPLRARVNLSHEDYAHACDAHRDLLNVSVHGTLIRGARIGSIIDHANFRILNDI